MCALEKDDKCQWRFQVDDNNVGVKKQCVPMSKAMTAVHTILYAFVQVVSLNNNNNSNN